MELANKVREAINSNNDENIRAVYREVFGSTIKKDCGGCYNEALHRLIKWVKRQTNMVNCKYKFTKDFAGKTVVIKVGGIRTAINDANLTNELAALLQANGRGHLLEENKAYTEVPNVKGVKKLTPETFAKPMDKPIPTLSTLKEAEIDGNELKENVSEKELNTKESQPLTGENLPKKRGRKPKVSA